MSGESSDSDSSIRTIRKVRTWKMADADKEKDTVPDGAVPKVETIVIDPVPSTSASSQVPIITVTPEIQPPGSKFPLPKIVTPTKVPLAKKTKTAASVEREAKAKEKAAKDEEKAKAKVLRKQADLKKEEEKEARERKEKR